MQIEENENALSGRPSKPKIKHFPSVMKLESVKMEIWVTNSGESACQGVWEPLGSVLDHSESVFGAPQPAKGI